MKEEQKPIAAWMRETMEMRGLTPTSWAAKAGVARNTISRAISDRCTFVTGTDTLDKLATAIDEKPPQWIYQPKIRLGIDITVAAIAGVLDAVDPDRPDKEGLARLLALSLQGTLREIESDPETASDPQEARRVANALARILNG